MIAPTVVDRIALRLVLEAYPGAHAISAYESDARGFYVGGAPPYDWFATIWCG